MPPIPRRADVLVRQRAGLVLAWLALLALAVCGTVARAAAGDETETILLHYNQRVPYEYLKDGRVQGLIAEPVAAAFTKAGIPFRWVEMPGARQFHVVKNNQSADCLSGRYKTPERGDWAKFSIPVYQDKPQGLLVRRDNALMKRYTSMAEAVKAKEVRLLTKLGYAYGTKINDWIAARREPAQVTWDESLDMLRWIGLKRADAMIIAEEEAQGLIDESGLLSSDYAFIKFTDAPSGEMRHIMCSERVSDETIRRLNAVIGFKASVPDERKSGAR